MQWSTGGDGKKYIFRVEALTGYLKNKYGKPDMEVSGDNLSLDGLKGKQGIVIFDMRGEGHSENASYTGHATFFDRDKTLDGSDYSGSSSKILFWEFPEGEE